MLCDFQYTQHMDIFQNQPLARECINEYTLYDPIM